MLKLNVKMVNIENIDRYGGRVHIEGYIPMNDIEKIEKSNIVALSDGEIKILERVLKLEKI